MIEALDPRPPAVEDLPRPHGWDYVRMAVWMSRGIVHGARRARGWQVVRARLALLGMVAAWATVVLVPLIQWISCQRPGARAYLSPERDAVLVILARPGRWHVDNHTAARPGSGQGARLRARLIPELTAHADRAGVAITAHTTSTRLAAIYAQEIPGLAITAGPDLLGRLTLCRPAPDDQPTRR